MISNNRVFAFFGGCIIALLILTGCQPDTSTSETTGRTALIPEEIAETVVAVKPVEVAQPTVEQHSIPSSPTKQEQPTPVLNIVEPISRSPTDLKPVIEPTASSPTARVTAIEPPKSSPTEESVPKILLIDYMADWDDLTYTRLIEIAASKGVEVDVVVQMDVYPQIDGGYDGIIVFGGGGGNYESRFDGTRNLLGDLHGFNVDGGRFVFFALPRLAIYNGFIGNPWIYAITVASEYITTPGKDVISVPGGVLSDMWSGLIIGSRTSYDEVSLQTYFRAKFIENFSHTSMSNRDGEQKKTSISQAQHGAGDFLFISNFVTGDADIQYRNAGNFLHDGNIDGWDNQRAAEILIDWLVGNQ